MGLSEDGDDRTESRFEDLCLDLNMDKDSKDEAWSSFQRIRENYTLEGDLLHWLTCALYVSCRKTQVPTIGKGAVIEGNCVSLTRLLRSGKLSLIEFFKKIKKWADMANLPQEFRDKIDRLERNFAVSTVIFKKFEPIWLDIFNNPQEDPPKAPRSRKQRSTVYHIQMTMVHFRRLPCTVTDVFNFCWTVFVQVKGTYPAIIDDLVNSYHLLLCAIDWIYANALLSNRRDLLNKTFSGLPEGFHNKESKPPTEVPCIIDLLCDKHEGLHIEAKGIKEHWWKPYIKKLFTKETLKGKVDNLTGALEIGTFEANSKEISKAYEEFVLNVGDFDERIFLGSDAHLEIGTPAKTGAPSVMGELEARRQVSQNLQKHFPENPLAPSTPLTGRRYLKDKEALKITPVSTATQSVGRLQAMLMGRKAQPSETLLEIFENCSTNPHDEILARTKEMGEVFCTKYAQPSEDHPGSHTDFAKIRLQYAETLYFKTLENIIVYEKNRLNLKNNKNVDLSGLLNQGGFHKSLFACCLEIVIFSYNSQRTFPWVLEMFELPAYSFYKVIEVLIRAEEGLSRDMVKHLNHIEEHILETLAWRGDSTLWEAIENNGGILPTVEEVSLPSQIEREEPQPAILSPIMNPAIRRVVTIGGRDPPQSPTSITDRFSSPVCGSAKRRLFGNGPEQGSAITVSQQQQVLTPTTSGPSLLEAALLQSSQPNIQQQKPKKTGSLALFLRKVYHLASVRLRDLCERLDVDSDLRSQMWTCFEHCLVHHTYLMRDRHLDQMLMCSVYVMAKVTGKDRSFQDIMRCYRLQPQAQSHVYRSVLLSSRHLPTSKRRMSESSDSSKHSGSNSPTNVQEDKERKRSERLASIRSTSALPVPHPDSRPPTPTRPAGTGSSFEFTDRDEDRGDLIKFYNALYVKKLKTFALKFSKNHQKEGGEMPPLSPLPMVRSHPQSPRRVSTKHSVYVSPHKSHTTLTPHMLYCFNRSPAKDLHAINNMLRLNDKGQMTMKRIALGGANEEVNGSPAKRICPNSSPMFSKKLEAVVMERKAGGSNVNGAR